MQSNQSSRSSILVSVISAVATLVMASTIAAAQTEKVLYSFQGGNDGANPSTGVIADAAGNLFGTTPHGGTGACTGGCGTVYKLTPGAGGQWTQSVIYNFQDGTDGVIPAAGLIFDAAGNLYGTTQKGGASNDGTIFRLTASGNAWTETVIHSLSHKEGNYPTASLIFDHAGNLYGTTLFEGRANGGTVFQLSPSGGKWTATVLHSFTGHKDGIDPAASLVLDQSGSLYGTTMGSNVFKLTPPAPGKTKWTFKSIYTFHGGPDGGALSPGTLLYASDGVLYGTQKYGGSPANAGAVFQLTPPARHGIWTENTIYRFAGGSDGLYPFAGVIADTAGNLYGTTAGDGQSSHGTVFQLMPPTQQGGNWSKTTLYTFTGGNDGSGPHAGLIFGKGGVLYSTTAGGGNSGNGTVFEIAP